MYEYFLFIGTTWTDFTFYIKNAFHMLSTEWNFLRNWSIMEMRLLWKSVLDVSANTERDNKCYVVWWWRLVTSDQCVVMTSPKQWSAGQQVTKTNRDTLSLTDLLSPTFWFWFSFAVEMWTADMTESFWLGGWIRLRGKTVILSEGIFILYFSI